MNKVKPMHLEDDEGHYSCIKAVGNKVTRKTKDKSKVTCKNCLRIILKMKEVKTFEEARIHSFKKWNRVKDALINVSNIIDEDCGFCEYSDYLFKKKSKKLDSCVFCPVETLCGKLLKIKVISYSEFNHFIYKLVDELETMKEENYKSRHQLKRDE